MEHVTNMGGGERVIQDAENMALQGVAGSGEFKRGDLSDGLNDHSVSGGVESALPSPQQGVCPEVAEHEPTPTPRSERSQISERTLAQVHTDPERHTVSLFLDDATANAVIYAVRVLAADCEAHAREVRLVGASLLPNSYGAANRLRIAGRHERLAERLRILERNYRSVVEGGWHPRSAPDT